jgi:chromosome segregation ATPase
MLGEYEEARRELSSIRENLQMLATHSELAANQQAELAFLRARTADLLRHIYVDSAATLKQLEQTLQEATAASLLETINRALKVPAPFRRALDSDNERQTVQILIDAAVWRSKFVWACGVGFAVAAVAMIALLGFNITELSKQGEVVRKTLVDAKAETERTISDARTQSQDNIRRLNEGIRDVDSKRIEVEKLHGKMVSQLEALQNPDEAVNKVLARFNTELSRLADLEREWTRQREKLVADLARHDSFLTGKEDEVTRKVSEFHNLATQHISTIEGIVARARNAESALAALTATARSNGDTIAALVGPAQADAKTIQTIREQATEILGSMRDSNEKVLAARSDAEGTRDGIRAIENQLKLDAAARVAALDLLVSAADETKRKVDAALAATTGAQSRFGEHIRVQQEVVDAAAVAASKTVGESRDKAVTSITAAADQAASLLGTSQAAVNRDLQSIRGAQNEADSRSAAIRSTANAVASLQTDITSKLEQLKTDEQQLRGERDRAKLVLDDALEIIRIVEDKRADVQEKLHRLLDDRPSIDSASIWKMILGNEVLLGLLVLNCVLLLGLLLTLVLAFRRRSARDKIV